MYNFYTHYNSVLYHAAAYRECNDVMNQDQAILQKKTHRNVICVSRQII